MSKGLMLGGPFLTCNRIPSKFYLSCEWKIYLNGTYLITNACYPVYQYIKEIYSCYGI